MIFDNISELVKSIQLQNKLVERDRELAEAQEKISTLNKTIQKQEGLLQIQGYNLEMAQRSRVNDYKPMTPMALRDLQVENAVKGYLQNPSTMPENLKAYIQNSNNQYAWNLIESPETWSPEFKEKVVAALEKIKPAKQNPVYQAMSDEERRKRGSRDNTKQ